MRTIAAGALALFLVTSCQIESKDPFIREIEAQRYTKDSLMRHDLNSPVPADQKKHFISLAYFEPKKEYVVSGSFEPLDSPVSVIFPFSQGDNETFYLVGNLKFDLLGKAYKLSAYKTEDQRKEARDADILFVPFWDKTNGYETYGRGRYLYVHYNGANPVELDFNAAANPNCAYDPNKSCPIPPKENGIPIRVEAGEKKW